VSKDDFYNEYNQKVLSKIAEEINEGTAKYVAKTIEELETMESE